MDFAGWLSGWFSCFFDTLTCFSYNFLMGLLGDFVAALIATLSLIPLPSALANFSWPDAGPLGAALGETGFVQGLSILAAAMTVKTALRLIPFVRL